MFKISFPFKNDDICKFVPNAIIAAGIIIAMRSDVIINETDEDIITRVDKKKVLWEFIFQKT